MVPSTAFWMVSMSVLPTVSERRRKGGRRCVFVVSLLLASASAGEPAAGGVYLSPEVFVSRALGVPAPSVNKLWLTSDLKQEIRVVLNHDLGVLRVPYWSDGRKSVWVLEEIGKERPITMGFVVEDARITAFEVLIFRESRGWEIRYPFFTEQFLGRRLTTGNELDRGIDGISGATLSVGAARRLARVALLLDRHVAGTRETQLTER